MRLAVFHNLPSGGAKRALHGLVKYLHDTGHGVDAYVPTTADESYLPLKDVVGRVHTYPVRRTVQGVLTDSYADLERTQEQIAKAINSESYDVVFSEQDRFVLTPYLLRFLSLPTVYYCPQPSRYQEAIRAKLAQSAPQTATPPVYKRVWRAYWTKRVQEIEKDNASYAQYVLTNSYFSREAILRAYGLNSYVSYLGVDTASFRPLAIPKENFVLSVGSCVPAKGFDFVIRCLGVLSDSIRPSMVIASNYGQPYWEAHLARLAAQSGVKLEIKKGVSDIELVKLYNRAKLFVYSSYLEPFGLAPLEAMSCGTPVVAIREGGVRESVLDNETGVLTERDENDFAGAVAALLQEEGWRARLGSRGAEVVRDFWTLENAGERLTRHLERAASREQAFGLSPHFSQPGPVGVGGDRTSVTAAAGPLI